MLYLTLTDIALVFIPLLTVAIATTIHEATASSF